MLQAHQVAFLELLVRSEVLRFGEFTLKSGRRSPYFVNAGQLRTGSAIDGLGEAYAAHLRHCGLRCGQAAVQRCGDGAGEELGKDLH